MRMKTEGLKEVSAAVAAMAGGADGALREMMEYAGREMAEAIRSGVTGHGLVDTGKLRDSVKASAPEIFSDSASVEVYPQGRSTRHRHSERNAVVGFVQEYGRRYGSRVRPGVGFFAEAVQNNEDRITDGMVRIWRDAEDGS